MLKTRELWSNLIQGIDQNYCVELERHSKVVVVDGIVSKATILILMGQISKAVYFLSFDGTTWKLLDTFYLTEMINKAKENVLDTLEVYSHNERIMNLPRELRIADKTTFKRVIETKPYAALVAIARKLDHTLVPRSRTITAETKTKLTSNIVEYLYEEPALLR